MDGVIIGLIVAGANVAVTTLIALVITTWWNKRQKKKEDDQAELERLREQARKQENKERDEAIKKDVHEEIEGLKQDVEKKIDNMDKNVAKELDDIDGELLSMKNAMQKDVRRSLRQDGKIYVERGWATDLEKTEFDELYWSYHNLGKNGVVDNLHEQVMHLPSEPKDN